MSRITDCEIANKAIYLLAATTIARVVIGEESSVNDSNTRNAEVLGQVLNLEPRTEQFLD